MWLQLNVNGMFSVHVGFSCTYHVYELTKLKKIIESFNPTSPLYTIKVQTHYSLAITKKNLFRSVGYFIFLLLLCYYEFKLEILFRGGAVLKEHLWICSIFFSNNTISFCARYVHRIFPISNALGAGALSSPSWTSTISAQPVS
jgi:hypothetical protein